ncbi:thioesterase [Rhodococcus sp. ACPA4]|uniref:PaaI family thioesterase n=1 Tax=Rhodococcus TaxID=1827 RepID=UPI000BB1150D|nr:hotdog domain-containing protein [Rhodococcus sp. ACPA4]PBC36074.1 thioesterase [Rhodococcus sp. ACPA4]
MSEFVSVGQEGTFLDHVGGIEWSREPDRVRTRLTVRPEHVNPNGTTHGGLLLTLLDFTLGVEVERSLGAGSMGHPITIQLSCSMIGAAALGETVEGIARVSSRTRTMTFVTGEIVSGERVLTTASGVFRNPRTAENPPARG